MTQSQRSIRRNLWSGAAVALVLLGSVGGWTATTDISGAVIAFGQLVVDTNVRKVQHPTGGVIGAIHVRNGDRVTAGDVLVQLDATITKANLAIVTRALDEIFARKARLEAERDDRSTVQFPGELTARASEAAVAHLMTGERRLFDLRRVARDGQKSQLRQRVSQFNQEVAGLEAQAAAKAREIVLIERELKGARELWDKELYSITKLTQLEREATRLDGERAQLLAASVQAKGKITETELQIVQVDRELASEVAKELREADAKTAELSERKVAAEDQLRRIEIRAPADGVVHQSTANTVGGVVAADGKPIMLIVPEGDILIVEAKAAAQDIDRVHAGQPAMVRFATFNQATTPEIAGEVTRISADAEMDERTGATYYTVRVVFGIKEVARLGEVKLAPGMPVEVFIKTGDRKVLSYLMKPLLDQFSRAFRER